MHKVCVVVPTYRSKAYFLKSFHALHQAVQPVAELHDVRILVVLNGSDDENKTQVEAALLQSGVPTELIVTATSGQNNATNTGLEYCRNNNIDIVQMVDDDQFYEPKTLLSNIQTLVSMRDRLGVLGLVGSRHLAPVTRWDGLTGWVASLAFEREKEAPKFCIGGSLCTWVTEFPILPPDEVGIANDAYVCNSFYERFRNLYFETGFMPIVFPKESIIYFNVSRNLNEYFRQQVRIRYGVLCAYDAFPEIKDELRAFFNWKFHCDSRFDQDRTVFNQLRWTLFRLLRKRANSLAEKRIAAGIIGIEWGVAHSSKKLEKVGLPAKELV